MNSRDGWLGDMGAARKQEQMLFFDLQIALEF